MNRMKQLQTKLKNRENALGTTIVNITWSGLIQKIAILPFDFLIFDTEHGTITPESIEESLRICRLCDLPSIVRVTDTVPHLISKTLDMGADGILLPRVETVAQVETAIRAMRYYPRGRKGCGGFSNLRPDDKGSTDQYNNNRLLFIQMESREGLAVLPEILDAYGSEIAGVLIGPYDASIMLETPLDICSDPMTDFIRSVFECCHTHNISCGSFVDNAAFLERYRSLGGNVFWTGTEISLLCEALGNLSEAFRDLNTKEAKTC